MQAWTAPHTSRATLTVVTAELPFCLHEQVDMHSVLALVLCRVGVHSVRKCCDDTVSLSSCLTISPGFVLECDLTSRASYYNRCPTLTDVQEGRQWLSCCRPRRHTHKRLCTITPCPVASHRTHFCVPLTPANCPDRAVLFDGGLVYPLSFTVCCVRAKVFWHRAPTTPAPQRLLVAQQGSMRMICSVHMCMCACGRWQTLQQRASGAS